MDGIEWQASVPLQVFFNKYGPFILDFLNSLRKAWLFWTRFLSVRMKNENCYEPASFLESLHIEVDYNDNSAFHSVTNKIITIIGGINYGRSWIVTWKENMEIQNIK
jgi:hypothetical protein